MPAKNLTTLISEKTNGQSISTSLKINGDHPLFEGHFPKNPITPGVVLLQLLKEQAESFSGHKLQMLRASNVKFLSVVVPKEENEIRLESEFKTNNGYFTGNSRIFYKGEICVKAKLVFCRV